MRSGQTVPEGLAAMAPGPDLGCLLAGIDPTRVANDDILEVLAAQSRQLAHDQARMFTAPTEVVHRLPFAGPGEIRRAEHPEPYGPDEVRAALAWTRRAAERETDLAHTLVTVLPTVHAALLAGLIDRPKAAVFARHLDDLTPDQVSAVCDAVLPHAPRLTTGQITDRIRRLLLELDPAYYQRRYRKAVRDRMVVAYLSPRRHRRHLRHRTARRRGRRRLGTPRHPGPHRPPRRTPRHPRPDPRRPRPRPPRRHPARTEP